MAPPKKYPDALRTQAVRLYRESDPKPTFRAMAADLGVHHEALRLWIRQAESEALVADSSHCASVSEENKRLRKRIADFERVIATRREPRPLPAAICDRMPL
ncbi:transposase [Nocardia tengchongensis]|uniref:transposase n=1 Tax=Nocardia tengchongensis TaxID=2055889 RepID=UPI00369C4870